MIHSLIDVVGRRRKEGARFASHLCASKSRFLAFLLPPLNCHSPSLEGTTLHSAICTMHSLAHLPLAVVMMSPPSPTLLLRSAFAALRGRGGRGVGAVSRWLVGGVEAD